LLGYRTLFCFTWNNYAHITYWYADKKGIAIKNLIHASRISEEAELALWFTEKELFSL